MTPERLRQIAILVDSLDTAQVDRLLDSLPEQVQQQVRHAVLDLPNIDERERAAVIQNFVKSQKKPVVDSPPRPQSAAATGTYGDPRLQRSSRAASPATPARGKEVPEYQKYLNRTASAAQHALPGQQPEMPGTEPPLNGGHSENENLVDALSQVDLETVAEVVLKESPQVLAVVLSLLPAEKSAALLELLPASLQQDALNRLTDLGEVDDQILDYLQQQLDRIVRRRVQLKHNQRTGPQALAAILSAAHRLQANQVVHSIHQQLQASSPNSARPSESNTTRLHSVSAAHSQSTSRPMDENRSANAHPTTHPTPASAASSLAIDEEKSNRTAERLSSPEANQVDAFPEAPIRFEFPRLVHCDRHSLETLLATAKPKLTLLALRGAPPKLLTRVLRLLPPAEAREVEQRIQNIGPTRLEDIQKAQAYLLRLASTLEDMGQFRRPRKSLLAF